MFSPFKKWVLTLYEYKCEHVHIAPENMMYALVYIYIVYIYNMGMNLSFYKVHAHQDN